MRQGFESLWTHRYALVMGVANRAKQLVTQEADYLENTHQKPISVAAKEVYEGKVVISRTLKPSVFSFSRFCTHTSFVYIFVFIAGQITFIARLLAAMVVVSISSAMPDAILPMTLYVAGAQHWKCMMLCLPTAQKLITSLWLQHQAITE